MPFIYCIEDPILTLLDGSPYIRRFKTTEQCMAHATSYGPCLIQFEMKEVSEEEYQKIGCLSTLKKEKNPAYYAKYKAAKARKDAEAKKAE